MQEVNGNGLMLVGIGASAGGVEALQRFFEHAPADGGLAYAVVMRTSPDYESRLAEVLQTKTEMPVVQVTERARVEPNCVYCLPPDKHIMISGGHIRLVESDMTNGHNAPIDLFFRALAHAYKEKAIAVVLSGAGADGSLGLGRVREEGGVSIAQEPSEAGHDSMPRSAVNTGWVDFVLPVAAIPDKLISLRQNAERIQLPPAETPARKLDEDALRELLALLRARTRHDFASYKRSTLLRRLERRLQVTESEDVRAYLEHVRKHPEELQGLMRDLLISVTNFFRDAEAFRRLQSEVEAERKIEAEKEGGALAPVVRRLEEELQRTRERLRATVEEYETSTGELKASNEELQAMNEELREKIDEITIVNSDLQNLLASTRVATVFLDRHLHVRRYTPSAQEMFNLIPGDVGRPLAHVTHKLDYDALVEDAARVLDDLVTVEREVAMTDGRWLTACLMPYRATDDKIDGVVLTFTDIHERKSAEEGMRASEERLRLVVETAEDYAIMLLDEEGRYTDWNTGAEKIFGYTKQEVAGQPTELIFTPEDRAAGVPAQELETADREGRASDERWHMHKDGSRFYCSGVMVSLRHGRGYAKIARDLTAQKQAQDELHRAWEDLERRVQERTAELANANSAMSEEVGERRRVEQERLGLLRRIVNTQEEERRRISRELHDQLGQSLTALRLKLESLSEETGRRSKLRGRINDLTEIAQRLDHDVDFLAWELRPSALDDLGLIVALSNYAQEWSKHFGVRVNFHSAGLGDARLAPLIETNFYRIAQEALNNVSKHAGAASVDLLLERRADHVVLIVEDSGHGFDTEQVHVSGEGRGMGLVGMRERAALVGGTVEIESTPGVGTTVFVRVPVKPDPSAPLAEGGSR